MEKQKEDYEKKTLQAIQKATEENTQAQSMMHILQGALQDSQKKSVRWQKLYEELRESTILLRKNQEQCTDQLLQLQNQLVYSREQEKLLREQCDTLQQDGEELRVVITLLKQENQSLQEELEELLEPPRQSLWNNITVQQPGQAAQQVFGIDIAKQLHQAENKLSMKERECLELKTELDILEQECYIYQTRLAQVREELNTLTARKSHSSSKRGFCGSIFCLCVFLLLMLIAVVAATCIYHPSVMDQFQDFCSALLKKLEDYLLLAASVQHAGCFKPI